MTNLPAPARPTPGGELVSAGVVQVDPIRNPYRTYLDNLQSAESQRSMRGCLDRMARLMRGAPLDDPAVSGQDFPWQALRYEHTIRLRSRLLEQGWSAAYINKHLVALRRVLKEAWRLELIPLEDAERAGDLKPEKVSKLPAGAHIDPAVLGLLLAVCDNPDDPGAPGDVRDRAILATLYTSGLRREELVGCTLAAWDPDEQSLRVLGKGNKERVAYVPADTARLIKEWVGVRGRTPGALFPPVRKGGQMRTAPDGRPAHMTGQAVRKILIKRIGQAAKLDPAILDRRVAPHDFRRTFIGELLDAGVDLATAQALVGHSSPATTARYDRRPEKTRRAAVQRLRLPSAAHPRPGVDQ